MTPSPTTSIAAAIARGLGPDFTSRERIHAECRRKLVDTSDVSRPADRPAPASVTE